VKNRKIPLFLFKLKKLIYLKIMNHLVKLAIYGGAAYLAYNYYTKSKANKRLLAAELSAPIDSEEDNLMLDAEMQEEGEEGIAIKYPPFGAKPYMPIVKPTSPRDGQFSEADGWDSDNLTHGI
tara:strand:- start:2596 stop:2964 length:369 start_codon:yes stop_codon:yes gene_type:complete